MKLTVIDNKPLSSIKSGDAVMLDSGNVYKIYETNKNTFLGFKLNGSGILGLRKDFQSAEELLGGLFIKQHYPAGEWELILKRKEGGY